MAKVPTPYSNLTFHSFDIFQPTHPALSDYITPRDHNCATSYPNALIGSRLGLSVAPPSFSTLRASTFVTSKQDTTAFDLLGFSIKPMESPPPGTTIYVKGYSHRRSKPSNWSVEFISDYHLPFLVNFKEHSSDPWTELHTVEIVADFGEAALDVGGLFPLLLDL